MEDVVYFVAMFSTFSIG